MQHSSTSSVTSSGTSSGRCFALGGRPLGATWPLPPLCALLFVPLSARPLVRVLVLVSLTSGCTLGPWQRDRVVTDARHVDERRGIERALVLSVERDEEAVDLLLVERASCQVTRRISRRDTLYEKRERNGWLAAQAVWLFAGVVVPLALPPSEDETGQRLVLMFAVAVPAAIVLVAESARKTERSSVSKRPDEVMELQPKECAAVAQAGASLELELSDGTRQQLRTGPDGRARARIPAALVVDVSLDGVLLKRVSPWEADSAR